MTGSFNFEIFPRHAHVHYRQPNVSEYERTKHIQLVHPGNDASQHQINCLPLPQALRDSEWDSVYIRRSWYGFWGKRLAAALSGALPRIASLFPGHTLPALKRGEVRYRGALAFEQYLHILPTNTAYQAFELGELPEPLSVWPWRFVEIPPVSPLSKIQPRINSCSRHQDMPAKEISDLMCCYLKGESSSIEDLLAAIHSAWSDTPAPIYNKRAVEVAKSLVEEHRSSRTLDEMVQLLFELELFASYFTFANPSNVIGSGLYENNWIEVEMRPLAGLRATELCQNDRLMVELLNLACHAFAPIVVNEYGCVTDGNHRLTAAWIWNILKACSKFSWSLDDPAFQRAVGDFVAKNTDAMGPVVSHQALTHLAFFAANQDYFAKLRQLRTLTEHNSSISEVPTVLLPEYSAPTVLKSLYDTGTSTMRLPASVYLTMSEKPLLVLPPRTPYHFTDSALLPWFSILSKQNDESFHQSVVRLAEPFSTSAIASR